MPLTKPLIEAKNGRDRVANIELDFPDAVDITLGLMIRDRERATAVAKAGEKLISQLFRTVELASDGTHAAASEDARRLIVQLIGKLDTELLWPIYKQYPDLEPERLRKKRHEP